jgi:hypothetical protein
MPFLQGLSYTSILRRATAAGSRRTSHAATTREAPLSCERGQQGRGEGWKELASRSPRHQRPAQRRFTTNPRNTTHCVAKHLERVRASASTAAPACAASSASELSELLDQATVACQTMVRFRQPVRERQAAGSVGPWRQAPRARECTGECSGRPGIHTAGLLDQVVQGGRTPAVCRARSFADSVTSRDCRDVIGEGGPGQARQAQQSRQSQVVVLRALPALTSAARAGGGSRWWQLALMAARAGRQIALGGSSR